MANFPATLIIIIYIIAHSEAIEIEWERYCNMRTEHILCSYANKTEFECNGKNLTTSTVTEEEKSIILDRFNHFRQNVAEAKIFFENGRSTGNASKMQELKWDTFLEEMAKARCMRCNVTYYNLHKDVKLESFTPYEMIASPSHPGVDDESVEREWNDTFLNAIDNIWIHQKYKLHSWDMFFGRYIYDFYIRIGMRNQNALMYSIIQVMKDDHYMIGCAKSSYFEQGNPIYFYACFTGASFNIDKESVIVYMGATATQCTDNKISDNYSGLCSSVDNETFPHVFEMESKSYNTTTTEDSTTVNATNGNNGTTDEDSSYNDDFGEGSRSSRNCCYWSFFFFCFGVAIFKE